MALTYLLNATWMGITSFVALSIIIHVMLNSVCNVEVFEQRFQYIDTEWGFCLNLSRFGEPSSRVFFLVAVAVTGIIYVVPPTRKLMAHYTVSACSMLRITVIKWS